jgi:predicted metalloenzyme YecM
MFESIRDFYDQAAEAVKAFDAFVSQQELSGRVVADHICYKCDSSESYEGMRAVFELRGAWLYQEVLGGRRIATIRTNESLETAAGAITLIELSDKKPDKPGETQREGFDHIEIYPTAGTYDELVQTLQSRGLKVDEKKREHHTTHDIKLESGFIVRLTRQSLAKKIKEEQMK